MPHDVADTRPAHAAALEEYETRAEQLERLIRQLGSTQVRRFWAAIQAGMERPQAAQAAGLTQVQVTRWWPTCGASLAWAALLAPKGTASN